MYALDSVRESMQSEDLASSVGGSVGLIKCELRFPQVFGVY